MKRFCVLLFTVVVGLSNSVINCSAQGISEPYKTALIGYWNTYTPDVGPDTSYIAEINGRKYQKGIDSVYFKVSDNRFIFGGNGGHVIIDSIEKKDDTYVLSAYFLGNDNKTTFREKIELVFSSATTFFIKNLPDQPWPGFYYPGPDISYIRAPIVE